MFRYWLREARESFGLTQGELGRLVGISPSALGMYEQGRRRPGPKSRARIREFFRERGVEMPLTFQQWEELKCSTPETMREFEYYPFN